MKFLRNLPFTFERRMQYRHGEHGAIQDHIIDIGIVSMMFSFIFTHYTNRVSFGPWPTQEDEQFIAAWNTFYDANPHAVDLTH